MTLEQRLQNVIGQQVFQIVSLSMQLEEAQAKIEELKKQIPPEDQKPTA